MKQDTKIDINEIIEKATLKHQQLINAATSLKIPIHKFIAQGMLDYFLTQISPMKLAEYTNARQKGLV